MKLLVCGSRVYGNYAEFERIMLAHLTNKPAERIISGGAHGADSLAEIFCKRHSIPITVMQPDWGYFGKRAGYARNLAMLAEADEVIAFWDGESKGTKHTIDTARKLGLHVTLIINTKGG